MSLVVHPEQVQSMAQFEQLFTDYMLEVCAENPDPSHDILHVKRVVETAKKLALLEKADLNVVIPAAYLHDCVSIAKTDARRILASRISAEKAIQLLKSWGYPEEHFPGIRHAIEAHSFSSGIQSESLEAKIVQDADRLDAMGAVGIFRCFAMSGQLRRPLCEFNDPFCKTRQPDDQTNTLDHFFTKLLHLQKKLNTESAKIKGESRARAMKAFLESLEREIGA